MTFLRPLALAALCASALSFSQTAAAQGNRPAAASKKLAVTVVFDERRSIGPIAVRDDVPEDSFSTEMGPPNKIPGWKRPDGEPPLTTVLFNLAREGDAVRIKVSAVLDDTWPPEAPGPKYGRSVRPVGTYLAREGETVSVDGLKRFGFQPLSLAVSEAKPETELPFDPAPARAVSRLNSIEVVSFAQEGANMERARLLIRNASQKSVVAVEVKMAEGYTQTAYRGGEQPLIEPGGTYEIQVSSGRRGAPESAPARQPGTLAVTAAVFADFSYEGDARVAAQMFARHVGRATQLARVLKLTEDALDSGTPDAPARLREQIAGLRIDVEPSALDEMLSKFPPRAGDDGRRVVASSAVEGLMSGRAEALGMLEMLESEQSQKGGGLDARRTLEEFHARVEKQSIARD
jgi:hypothetical protein